MKSSDAILLRKDEKRFTYICVNQSIYIYIYIYIYTYI